jgi:16S rRNA (uracil1498-N3)-methyltransferase
MGLRRFWIEIKPQGSITIDGELFHHIRDVCRFGVGDQFELLPGDETAYLAKITELGKHKLQAAILSQRALEPLKKPHIHLALSVPRYSTVDFILEKSVELGVHTISLFTSDFSFPKKLSDLSENRFQRWQKINKGAAQQSGRGTLMNLSTPTTLENCLKIFKERGAQGLFPFEGEAALGWKAAVEQVRAKNPDEIWIFVGSEGGFSPKEVELFQRFGLQAMTMGTQILRVETACVALVSVIKYEFEV